MLQLLQADGRLMYMYASNPPKAKKAVEKYKSKKFHSRKRTLMLMLQMTLRRKES